MVHHPELIAFVLRAKNRNQVLLLLEKGTKLQTQLSKESNMYKSHTSRTLKELIEKKLILCKNPDDRSFRFYAITKLGKQILSQIKKLNKQI